MFPIGICTDFVNLPEAATLGFDYLEVSLRDIAALTEAEFQEFVDYTQAIGANVAACRDMLPEELPVTGPEVNATQLHGYLSHALGRARRLGVSVVTLDSGKSRAVNDDGDVAFAWRQLGNFLRLAQGHARECGVVIAVEPVRRFRGSLLNTVSEATLLAALLQLDHVAVGVHTGNMAMASEPAGVLRQAAPLLRHVHAESTLSGELPGPADADEYRRLLETLREINYAGGVSLCGAIDERFIPRARAALECFRRLQLA